MALPIFAPQCCSHYDLGLASVEMEARVPVELLHHLPLEIPSIRCFLRKPERVRHFWYANLREANLRCERSQINIRARRQQVFSQANDAEVGFIDPGDSLEENGNRCSLEGHFPREFHFVGDLREGQNDRRMSIHALASQITKPRFDEVTRIEQHPGVSGALRAPLTPGCCSIRVTSSNRGFVIWDASAWMDMRRSFWPSRKSPTK